MTAEEFIREKIRAKNLFPEKYSMEGLQNYTVTGEDCLRWAHEFANQDKWIYNLPPELIEGQNYSENVLAVTEQHTDVQVMCFCYNPSEDEEECGFFWANCNKQLDGDAEFDDNYNVIKWQPIPKI